MLDVVGDGVVVVGGEVLGGALGHALALQIHVVVEVVGRRRLGLLPGVNILYWNKLYWIKKFRFLAKNYLKY